MEKDKDLILQQGQLAAETDALKAEPKANIPPLTEKELFINIQVDKPVQEYPVQPGTLLKLKPKYKYGYEVSYDQYGNPTFKLMVDGREKAMTDATRKEAMGLYEKELTK